MSDAGYRDSSKRWVAPNKVKIFKKMFDAISRKVGCKKARVLIPIGSSANTMLNRGEVSELNATRILNTYKKMF